MTVPSLRAPIASTANARNTFSCRELPFWLTPET